MKDLEVHYISYYWTKGVWITVLDLDPDSWQHFHLPTSLWFLHLEICIVHQIEAMTRSYVFMNIIDGYIMFLRAL